MLEFSLQGEVGTLSLDASLRTGGGPLVLIGQNGAGKSTLLRMILGIIKPRAGRVVVGGRVLFDSLGGVDLSPEERHLGYVPQGYALFPHLSSLGNVSFALAAREPRLSALARRVRATALLERLGVAWAADRRPASLSGGEKQRVALARALAASPEALLLDEPLAALDANRRGQVRSFLAEHLSELALPAIVVTHDLMDAKGLGRVIAVLEHGSIVQTGTLDEIMEKPASPFVTDFVSGRI